MIAIFSNYGSYQRKNSHKKGRLISSGRFGFKWKIDCLDLLFGTFVPALPRIYANLEGIIIILKTVQEDVEVIFVPWEWDQTTSEMIAYMKEESHGDWFGLKPITGLMQVLEKQFNVIGIPTLVVLKADGTVISKDAINAVCTQGPRWLVVKWMQQSRSSSRLIRS